MHNGYINIDNEKMSKSLGNFVLVHDIIQHHDPQVLRFFMLSVHYRHPINYSEEVLEKTKAAFDRLKTSFQNLKHRLDASTGLTDKQRFMVEENWRIYMMNSPVKWTMTLIRLMPFLSYSNFPNKPITI